MNDDGVEGIRVTPVDESAEMFAGDRFGFANQSFGLGGARDEAQVHFADPGAISDIEAAGHERREFRRDAFFEE